MTKDPKIPMTAYREQIEFEKLRTALYRWYRLGGDYDKVIAVCDVLYNAGVGRALDRLLGKKKKD